jgi:uncharacterized protein YdhG (YjbR/CyaY superfamily)
MTMATMGREVQVYINAIAPENRPLFGRLHALILAAYPDATVVLSYKMPTYEVGELRLHVAAWKHGVSIYGWQQGRQNAFTARHPTLRTSKGTLRLRPEDAAAISDDEFTGLVRGALGS